MIREWDQSLRDARVRGVKPKDRARQLAEDINLAQFVLASSDSGLMSWVTTRQIIAAADVLIAHEALGDQQCLYLLRRLVKSSGDEEAELRRVIADGGPAMVRRIAMEREWLGDTLAIRLLTSIAEADNKSLAELPAIAADRDQPEALRISSIELMHGVVTAAGATLPDTIATSLRDLSGHPDPSIAGAAAATLNRLSNRDPSRAVSDKGSVPADVVERSPPPIFDVGSAVAATLPAMKRSAEMNVELANSLIEAYEKDRALIPLGAVVVAADALLARDALNPRLMSGLIRRAYESTDVDAMELRRLLAKQGEVIVPVLLEYGAAIGTDAAAAMMRDAARIEPRAMGRLMAVNQSASWGIYELEAAIRLLDRVTKGKDALPLPDDILRAWMDIVEAGHTRTAAAAIDALIARPQSGFVEADRRGLMMLNFICSRYPKDIAAADQFLADLKPGRAQALVEARLVHNLSSDEMRIRETSAGLLSRWTVLTGETIPAIASFLAGSPILDMQNQDPGSDQRVFQACAKRLAAEGPRIAAVVPRLVPGLNDPVRQRWIVDVLRSVNPTTVRASLVERYRQLVRDRVDESGQLAYVGSVVELAKTDTAAERAMLDILYSNPKSLAVRRQLVAALASSVNETANVRAALWWEARSSAAEIRQAAVESLAVVGPGDDADLGFAVEWIKTGTAEQRIAAARLIAAAGPRVAETSIPPLLRMSDNVCSLQRGAAATALAKINPAGDRLTPAVVASVYHRDPTMRSHLIAAAKKAGDPKLIERLKDIAENEPDPAVKAAAREAMAALGK